MQNVRPLGSLLAALALVACGEGDLLTLGEQAGLPVAAGEFGNVVRVEEVSVAGEDDENPTLTSDMLEIYFNSERDEGTEGSDVWYARRSSVDQGFGEPRPVGGWSDEGSDSSPAVSGDGLTLWLAHTPETEDDSEEATTDVRMVVRDDPSEADWQGPIAVQGLNTADDERPRPLGQGGLVMPLSRRVQTADGETVWQTLLARREGDAQFSEPVLLSELVDPEVSAVDGFLSLDGLTLVFKVEPPGEDGDLYWSKRASVDAPFVGATAVPGVDVNTDDSDERDPWLSPDGAVLYFASDRGGDALDVYRAELVSE